MKNWIYLGIFLDDESKEDLKELFPTPKGWKEYYDHMTVVFNDGSRIANIVKEYNETNIGGEFPLVITGVGISENAMAVKVKLPLGVICTNPIPHITLCVSPEGKPSDSNNIEIWHDVDQVELWGTMKVYEGK
jgi:hypothetical protein